MRCNVDWGEFGIWLLNPFAHFRRDFNQGFSVGLHFVINEHLNQNTWSVFDVNEQNEHA